MLGALCSRTAHREPPKRQPWLFSFGYRYQPSTRHFIGTVEQQERELRGTQILNIYHLMDFGISRQISPR